MQILGIYQGRPKQKKENLCMTASKNNYGCGDWYICDMIKGNESHVGHVQFWFFDIICQFKMLYFDLNPISNGHLAAEIWDFL